MTLRTSDLGSALARALTARLKLVLPAEVSISSEGALVSVTDGHFQSTEELDWFFGESDFDPERFQSGGISFSEDKLDFSLSRSKEGRGSSVVADMEQISVVAYHVLSAVQDFISESLKTPWPTDPKDNNKLPTPNIEWKGETLRLCYGDLQSPVLELPEIRIQELRNLPS
jgi:hypothetical protein